MNLYQWKKALETDAEVLMHRAAMKRTSASILAENAGSPTAESAAIARSGLHDLRAAAELLMIASLVPGNKPNDRGRGQK